MNQLEIKTLFEWAEMQLSTFESQDCEESIHCYFNDTYVGGWAGDTRAYFYKHNDDLAKLIRMFDAYHKD